jgi:putative ABC transport system permease protein
VYLLSARERFFASPEDRRGRLEDLLRRTRGLDGVSAAALTSNVPFSGDLFEGPVQVVGEPAREASAALAEVRVVSPELFRVLEVPLLRGRGFEAADGPGAPRVAIVKRSLARRLAPLGEVLGLTVRIGAGERVAEHRVVGVVEDSRSLGTTPEVRNEVYVPYGQRDADLLWLVVESPLPSSRLTPAIRRELRAAMPRLPLRADEQAEPLEELVARALAGPRFGAVLMTAFSALALLLAASGLFGLVSFTVSRRRRELAVRSAIGAAPRDLVRVAVASATGAATLGVVLGLAAAVPVMRLVRSQLYTRELDAPASLIHGGLAMLLVAAAAAYLPARRAVGADPVAALRED